jgi:hypothetical protein
MRQGRLTQTFAKYLERDYPRCGAIEDDPAKRQILSADAVVLALPLAITILKWKLLFRVSAGRLG